MDPQDLLMVLATGRSSTVFSGKIMERHRHSTGESTGRRSQIREKKYPRNKEARKSFRSG